MSVQFRQNPQQVVRISEDDGNQHLQSPYRVPLDRMTSRSENPYSEVQDQLTQVQLDSSREEHNERQRVRRIFDRVRLDSIAQLMTHTMWQNGEISFSSTIITTVFWSEGNYGGWLKSTLLSVLTYQKAWLNKFSRFMTKTVMDCSASRSSSSSVKNTIGSCVIGV